MHKYPLLKKIQSPCDLRKLDKKDLPILCNELRGYLLESVSKTGGHLASGLGVVEITVAIHYVFDTPKDNLIWDVGHQSYPHKILTGRREKMDTMKKYNGISGFPKRDESDYDDFGVGHSSTSISAALGMAIADKINNNKNSHIAVIGDGAMTAGMAFEALHHAASLSANILVILNDNDMSISPNTGGLSSYLSKVLTSDLYQDVRNKSKKVLKHIPPFDGLAKFAENRVKDIAGFSNIFEDFGFNYKGPQDGHNIISLIESLKEIKKQQGPQLLHIKTVKGKGYNKAEEAPVDYHGVSAFDLKTGLNKIKKSPPTFTKVFSYWLVDMAEYDKKLIGITPAMSEGSGLAEFRNKFPDRYFDVAIAEQHAVTLAAGMACNNTKPVVAIYSTFLQRAYDQLIHDVAIQNLDILFAVDRAGIVGEDGATHAGVFDIAFCRLIPNIIIMAPSNEYEMIKMLNTGYIHNGPVIVRYPKGPGALGYIPKNNKEIINIGKAKTINKGKDIAVLCFGTLINEFTDIANEKNITLIDMRFIKPIDEKILISLIVDHSYFITVEEGAVLGGVGEQVSGFLYKQKNNIYVKNIGIQDKFVEHGNRDEVLSQNKLDKESFKAIIDDFKHDK